MKPRFVKTMNMFGKLTQEEIENTIHRQLVGRIGCHADGLTYVVPISYAYDGKYIYGHTLEGMKTKMMRKNQTVCFEVDDTQNMANWQSVIAWGEYEELDQEAERVIAIKILHNRVLPIITSDTTKLSPDWPFAPADMNSVKGIVFRIQLFNKSGRYENNTVPSFMGWG